ncbi:MAG TPA: transcriptional regulator GcvA [Casimicrobiaceae bacterium]|nr:transcriptional regulator GcvA [Casimicrobiaceae bacterium]
MARRLPPLNSLRAFEAAARHQSVSAAARELFVTHGAVSRHVAKLEEYLGARLFVREGSHLRLTHDGEAYAAGLSQVFDKLHELTALRVAGGRSDTLRIGAYPTFADKVLIPRLAQFREAHPGIGFQIETSHTALEPHDLEVDVAVRLGEGDWTGLSCHYLFDEELMPVGSPSLRCGRKLTDARDFEHLVLLHAQHRPNDWESWLRSAGITDVDAHSGMRFDHSGMVYQAAINGLGLAMAQTAHVRDDLAQNRLVAYADTPMKTKRAYYVVHLPSRARDPVVTAFVRWLTAELGPR